MVSGGVYEIYQNTEVSNLVYRLPNLLILTIILNVYYSLEFAKSWKFSKSSKSKF